MVAYEVGNRSVNTKTGGTEHPPEPTCTELAPNPVVVRASLLLVRVEPFHERLTRGPRPGPA
jgi:hypothetical protein